jgi:hypothetical protein
MNGDLVGNWSYTLGAHTADAAPAEVLLLLLPLIN